MTINTFEVVTQKQMGTVRPRQHKKLKQLEARRQALELELTAVIEASDAVLEKATKKLKIDTDGPFRGLHLSEDGTLTVMYCPCVICQANVNNVTVTEAATIMLSRGLLPNEDPAQLMKRAAAVDKGKKAPYVH